MAFYDCVRTLHTVPNDLLVAISSFEASRTSPQLLSFLTFLEAQGAVLLSRLWHGKSLETHRNKT